MVWEAGGGGARNLVVSNPRNEPERSRNRRVDIALSASISASYPVLVKRPGIGYTWTVRGSSGLEPADEAEYQLATFPDPAGVSDSLRVPHKWICSLMVDFGPATGPGPIVMGSRIA